MLITQYDDKEAETSHSHRSTSPHSINIGTCIYKAGAGIYTIYLLQLSFIFILQAGYNNGLVTCLTVNNI